MPARLLQLFYDVGYLFLMLLGLPFFLFKMATSRRWRSGLGERLGGVEPRTGDRRCLWIHGVSVGEVLAAQTLVARINEEMPDWEVVISTTTRTGQDVAKRTYPGCRIFYYPLDLSFATGRVIRRIRPDAVLLVELEIWPNFLLATSRQDVPVFLVNGRITERSLKGYKRLQWLVPEPMDRIGLYCVQTPAYRDRFLSLGVPGERVFVTGTMKFDTVTAEESEDVRQAFLDAFGFDEGDWVLIAGSTHDGEEKLVLEAYRAVSDRDPRARLVLAPRHLERLADVEAAVRDAGFEPVRRTAEVTEPGEARRVVVLDTMGELASSYAAADVVYVGGSLVPHGGQNVLEPAGLAKPVLTGPHCWNFDEVVEALAESGGLEMVRDAAGLREAVLRLHGDREEAARRGAAVLDTVVRGQGATRRILDLVRKKLAVTEEQGA